MIDFPLDFGLSRKVHISAFKIILAKITDMDFHSEKPAVLPVAPFLYENLEYEFMDHAQKMRLPLARPLKVDGVEIVSSFSGWRPSVYLKDGRRLVVGSYVADPLEKLI